MDYRKLTDFEIEALKKQGCSAEKWDTVLVKNGFMPERIGNIHFEGLVKLGVYKTSLEVDNGISKPSGLFNSYIQNCKIDDNVYISDVKNLVNYHIESNVVIENVGTLAVTHKSAFGNGTEIEILNEGGGRELPIFDKLTSQIAYIMVNYRHDSTLIKRLKSMIENYISSKRSSQGTIGKGARIINSSVVRNVNIGEHALISGALHLEEGTIGSFEEAPTIVGAGVVAKEFIILSGSIVDNCALLSRSFVGQGVQIGKQYSAENSCFFTNFEGFHGEACSIFAGPYSVTHHKSTLLIAGLFSFYNAGSGTNQSNHMYKLGPLHQGILERGSKTGSFCYLPWPCRVGAFTAVIGKHNSNFDTSEFPFSYIFEEGGKSILTPAMNLFTVGTRRDSSKWPRRDRRKDPVRRDLINFELFSPYTVGRILQGIERLKNLYDNASKKQEVVNYKGIQIKRLLLKTCSKYYEMAVKIYIGNEVVERLLGLTSADSFENVKEMLKPEGSDGCGNWIDMSGMLAPLNEVETLLDSVRTGQIAIIDDLLNRLKAIHEDYKKLAWNWCVDLIQKRFGIDFKEISQQTLVQIINGWKDSSVKLNNMILTDAEKEFDTTSRIGFGIDGDEDVKAKDFEAVRGTYYGNKFVVELKKESDAIQQSAENLIRILEKL